MFGSDFNMTHELAITLQYSMGISNLDAPKEPDIDLSLNTFT